ncbi:MerR family transcriptional regulator [Mesonia sp. MT50]|uniref:MerR family transcriptional regulator n=1 Tax=Mesonia profundi TaxID=3070998 RepID=A0ABU0ZZ57_9FLAO|nr:MerR family transcriptional regulator [Mesonia profundi]MDQ7916748.1 MerR family transcriptional regulator [Mesonia profundi]
MSYIKKEFSIKDLEILSGVKAHTIRIWEKRYHILEPNRTETNIRVYDTIALQKLLNIAFLNENGYKISRISKLSDEEIADLVQSTSSSNNYENRALKSLLVAMFNFDQVLFLKTYGELLETRTFSEIFKDIFIPFLNQIGLLWQTSTITPSHEHFISNLIRQKVYSNIEKLQYEEAFHKDRLFILFLPENEIHDLGILFANYELLSLGYRVIFLGHTIPLENLNTFTNMAKEVYYISHFTTKPENPSEYIKNFTKEVLQDSNKIKLWVLGRKSTDINPSLLNENIAVFSNISSLSLQL